MKNLLEAIKENDFLRGLEILLKDLRREGVIDGAVLFYGDSFDAMIITDLARITGYTLQDIKGIAKSYIWKAIEEKREIFEDELTVRRGSESSMFYQITSIYVSPILVDKKVAGVLYIDRLRNENKFSGAERLWFKFMGNIFQQFIDLYKQESILDNLQREIWLGKSSASEEIRKKIKKFARFSPVLILGETGTGKTLVAELLHRFSGRPGKFVVVSSPNIPESLFESEIFGSKKGAFTGAVERKGLVEEAENGTLFFDEISEIPLHLQAKLLRFIETGTYKRLGESRERKVNTHIICASNRDLEKETESGKFRKDLYFRISVYLIKIPPLRERKEDIEEIAINYLRKNGYRIDDDAIKLLTEYDFPGNVRELQNVLNRIMVETEGRITSRDITREFTTPRKTGGDRLSEIFKAMEEGATFWDVVKKPYLARELNRNEVRMIIEKGLERVKSYKELCRIFNIPQEDYHRFMTFLHKQGLIKKK